MTRQSVTEPHCQPTAFVHLLQVVAVTANEASTVEDALQCCLDQVCRQTGWPVGHAYLVADDGTGVLVPTALWHLVTPDHGLAGMRERARALGGQLTIDSTPGVGTCILAELPLRSTSVVPPPSAG
jgi:glucose-6-phosphate-specific signal transduction histidine kinase